MRITAIHERNVPIAAPMRNAAIGFDEMTASAVAIETDVIRGGRPVIGYGFSSIGRYAHGGLLRERFAPRLLAAAPADYRDEARDNLDPERAWPLLMRHEKPGGHGERSGAVGVLDMALWDIVAKLDALATKSHLPAVEGTFARTDRHERDRRAKTGQQDNPNAPDPLTGAKPNTKAAVMPTKGMLSNKEWKIVRVSSENTDNKKFGRNAIDGDPTTLWHTKFSGTVAPPPHELVIDLGAERTIRGFVYLGRQDAGWNGAIKEIEFCISPSPEKFGEPTIKTKLAKKKEPQTIECPATKGRYILLRSHSAYSEQSFASVAELGVLGE